MLRRCFARLSLYSSVMDIDRGIKPIHKERQAGPCVRSRGENRTKPIPMKEIHDDNWESRRECYVGLILLPAARWIDRW